MDLTLIISFGILLGCIISLSWFAGYDAPYIPTKQKDLDKLFKILKIKKGQKFYELGSGDGRVVLEAARQGAFSFGIEQSWLRVLYSRWKAKRLNLNNAKFIHGNIFDRTYTNADIVFIYLLTPAVLRLEKKLKKELKKGSLVITQKYHFQNWEPIYKTENFCYYQA